MKRRIWQTGCRISKQRVIAQVIWERLQGGDREGGVAQEAAPGTRHMHQPACYYAVQDSLSSTWYLYSNILWMMLFSNEPASIPSTCYYTVLGTMLACCTWYDDYLELEQVGACLVLGTTTLGTQYYNIVLECTRGTILYSVPCHAMLQSRSTHPI